MPASITRAELEALKPCGMTERLVLFGDGDTMNVNQALAKGVSISDILWVAGRLGKKRECVLFAFRCARRVAHFNPDPCVQQALDATRIWLDDPTLKNARAAKAAAWAAWAAGAAWAVDAADAAAWAAGAAWAADAAAAAWTAADAADAAAWAAGAAWAADAAAAAWTAADAAWTAADAACACATAVDAADAAAELNAQKAILVEVFAD